MAKESIDRKRCEAMVAASITDPVSQDGIDFCTKSCPYEYCVVLESPVTGKQIHYREKARLARELRKQRVSITDIAVRLNLSERNVRRYVKE
ncbi:hypothetical protein LCGC14_2111800 [marine sediment metagenome]|uniref:Uncharacterized protein n=1 Tax=marine sediment metagenome TaxID=412755 RepID=A0A0F9E6Y6_9ZZZZ